MHSLPFNMLRRQWTKEGFVSSQYDIKLNHEHDVVSRAGYFALLDLALSPLAALRAMGVCVWTIWKDVKPLFSIFEFTFWFVYIIPVQAGGPSMYCERWSNEAATVHADITADHRDVPASFFHVIFRDVPWLTQEPSCRVLKMKVTIWFRWMCCI